MAEPVTLTLIQGAVFEIECIVDRSLNKSCVTIFRQDPESAMTKSVNSKPIHLELPSPTEKIKGHPLFGNLNPFDILQHLLKQSMKT